MVYLLACLFSFAEPADTMAKRRRDGDDSANTASDCSKSAKTRSQVSPIASLDAAQQATVRALAEEYLVDVGKKDAPVFAAAQEGQEAVAATGC